MQYERLKTQYDILKENLSIILLLPTIIGGVWQIVELSSISTSFIRFFSLTQLVADGILILFILIIFLIFYKLVCGSLDINSFKFKPRNAPPLSYGITLTLLILMTFFLLREELIHFYYSKNNSLGENALIISVLIMLIGALIIGIISILENIVIKNINRNNNLVNKFKPFFEFIFKLIIMLLFFVVLKIFLVNLTPQFSNFRKRIVLPDNLLNKDILDKKIIKEYNLKFIPKLIYFNDKFIFYEVHDINKNKKILIIDFNTLINK